MLTKSAVPALRTATCHRLPIIPITASPSSLLFLRHASTTSPSASTLQSQATTSAAAKFSPSSTEKLDWDSFLRLRKLRRRYNLVSSIFTAGVGTSVGLGVLMNKEIDVTQTILGMDPLIMFILATFGSGAAGWLVGPAIGSAAFGVVKRKHIGQIAVREKEFLQHIKKHRVDPSFQSFSNPVPDYYGEKIGSVKQYRQWLKDQRAYNRKREKFL